MISNSSSSNSDFLLRKTRDRHNKLWLLTEIILGRYDSLTSEGFVIG